MLRSAEMRVLDVAIACGFKTQQHFARVFRHLCGTSPREYRLESWSAIDLNGATVQIHEQSLFHLNAYEFWSRDVRESFWRNKVLFNNEDPIAPLDGSTELESTEISTFLGHSTLRRPSSVELGWKNFAIERRTTLPCEKPGVELQNHFLIL